MTLSDIKNQLFSHFLKKDYFSISEHADSITVASDFLESKEKLIAATMEDLIDIDIVAPLDDGRWILKAPIISIPQTVQIGGTTAELIADFVNSYRDANNIKGDLCNKFQISERDIVNLLQISHAILNAEVKNDEPELD